MSDKTTTSTDQDELDLEALVRAEMSNGSITENALQQFDADLHEGETEEERKARRLKEVSVLYKGRDGKPGNPNPVITKQGNPGFGPGNTVSKLGAAARKAKTGRRQTVMIMDAVLAQPEVQKAIAEALVEKLKSGGKDALDALRNIVLPFTPQHFLDETAQAGDDKGSGAGDPSKGVTIILNQQAAAVATPSSTQEGQR